MNFGRMNFAMNFRILLAIIPLLLLAACAPHVQQGDNVTVLYTGTFTNGTVFDTNNPLVAKEAGIYNPRRKYEPLVVHLGKHDVVPGFEKALLGMKPGEEKRVTLSPTEAYGAYDPEKVSTLNRIETKKRYAIVPRTVRVPDAIFRKRHPNARPGNTIQQGNESYRFLGEENGSDDLLLLKRAGEQVRLPNVPWPFTILQVLNETFFTRQDPVNGSIVTTQLGPALVTTNATSVTMKLSPPIGAKYKTKLGVGRVVALNDTTVTIDFNPPLAGKNLTFDLTVVTINGQT